MNWTQEPDITLTDFLRKQITRLADVYAMLSGGTLHCTSGLRTTLSQATAMYDNYKHDRQVGYSQKDLECEVQQAWRAGFTRKGYSAVQTIGDMVKVLDAQVSRGKFLSAHMTGNAADFSKRDVDEQKLQMACNECGVFLYPERHCYHVTFHA